MSFHVEVVTAPGIEPITVAEAKAHLRISFADDDALIGDLIGTAREMVETEVSRSLINRQSNLFLDFFPGGAPLFAILREIQRGYHQRPSEINDTIFIPIPPLVSVDQITYTDPNGNVVTMDPATYRVSTGTPGRITSLYGVPWPVTRAVADAVTIKMTTGYGTTTDAIPRCSRSATKLLTAHLYENRSDGVIPEHIKRILAPINWGRYR